MFQNNNPKKIFWISEFEHLGWIRKNSMHQETLTKRCLNLENLMTHKMANFFSSVRPQPKYWNYLNFLIRNGVTSHNFVFVMQIFLVFFSTSDYKCPKLYFVNLRHTGIIYVSNLFIRFVVALGKCLGENFYIPIYSFNDPPPLLNDPPL